jgi:hypothetical protein
LIVNNHSTLADGTKNNIAITDHLSSREYCVIILVQLRLDEKVHTEQDSKVLKTYGLYPVRSVRKYSSMKEGESQKIDSPDLS